MWNSLRKASSSFCLQSRYELVGWLYYKNAELCFFPPGFWRYLFMCPTFAKCEFVKLILCNLNKGPFPKWRCSFSHPLCLPICLCLLGSARRFCKVGSHLVQKLLAQSCCRLWCRRGYSELSSFRISTEILAGSPTRVHQNIVTLSV